MSDKQIFYTLFTDDGDDGDNDDGGGGDGDDDGDDDDDDNDDDDDDDDDHDDDDDDDGDNPRKLQYLLLTNKETSCRPMSVCNHTRAEQIGLPLVTTRMIPDRIGLDSVLLPLLIPTFCPDFHAPYPYRPYSNSTAVRQR